MGKKTFQSLFNWPLGRTFTLAILFCLDYLFLTPQGANNVQLFRDGNHSDCLKPQDTLSTWIKFFPVFPWDQGSMDKSHLFVITSDCKFQKNIFHRERNLGLHFILVFIPDVNVPCKEFDNGTSLHIAASNLCLEGAKCLVSLAGLLLGYITGQFKENHPSQKNYLLVFHIKTLVLIFNLL